MVGSRLVVLDRGASRYQMIADDLEVRARIVSPDQPNATLLWWPDDEDCRLATARQWIAPGALADLPVDAGRRSLVAAAELCWRERRATIALRGGLASGLAQIADRSRGRGCGNPASLLQAANAVPVWHPATDRCLPRSLALAGALRARGSQALLCIGVALFPFMAHAWVQLGHTVVNDRLDHVRLFTPIYVA